MSTRERLRVAVQKSGRLSKPCLDLLERCDLRFQRSRDGLFCFGEDTPVDLLLMRDDDIPAMLAQGVCDVGIVGRNVLVEYQGNGGDATLRTLRNLGFGRCRLAIAVPEERGYADPGSLDGMRIATTYPRTLGAWLRANGVAAEVLTLAGSVEIAPRLGTADAICDLVQTGATLAANQLREVDQVLQSEAVLVAPTADPAGARGELVGTLLRRVDGVTRMRGSRFLFLHAARDCVDAIKAALPDSLQPQVLQVEGEPDEVMLQALYPGELGWPQLEAIQRAGAHDLFVLPVERALP